MAEAYIEPAGQKAHILRRSEFPGVSPYTHCGQFIPHGPRMRTTVRPPEQRLCKTCVRAALKGDSDAR